MAHKVSKTGQKLANLIQNAQKHATGARNRHSDRQNHPDTSVGVILFAERVYNSTRSVYNYFMTKTKTNLNGIEHACNVVLSHYTHIEIDRLCAQSCWATPEDDSDRNYVEGLIQAYVNVLTYGVEVNAVERASAASDVIAKWLIENQPKTVDPEESDIEPYEFFDEITKLRFVLVVIQSAFPADQIVGEIAKILDAS